LIPSIPVLPIILSTVGVVGLTIAGWLGGELVFKHRVAVAASTDAVPDQPETQRHIRAA